jgi:hypothetical protein
MSDTFTEKEMNSLAKYVQKKERRIFALNSSIQQFGGPNTIYGYELNELLLMVYEDELPGSLKLQTSMPKLYPKIQKAPEKKEEGEEPEE